MVADSDGFISRVPIEDGDDKKPVFIDGKRLVLPIEAQLRNGDTANRIIFHPLCESAHKGESEIVSLLRHSITQRLNAVVCQLLIEFIALSLNQELHNRLNPNQVVVLSLLKDADKQLIQNIESIMMHAIKHKEHLDFVKIYLRRSGMINGKSVARAAIVSFPFYEKLVKDDAGTIHGVKLRKKDKALLIALFEYIFPGININGAYDRGSLSNVAPFLDALTQATANIVGCITAQADNYKNFFTDTSEFYIEAGWEEAFQCLGDLLPQIRAIPPQLINEGTTKLTEQQHSQLPNNVPQTVMPAQPVQGHNTPVVMPNIGNTGISHQPHSNKNSVSIRDFLAQRMMSVQQPMPQQMNPFGFQQQPQFNPMYQNPGFDSGL